MSRPERQNTPRLWTLVAVVVGAAVTLVAAAVGIGVWLSATIYSAPAFVERYFATIATDDVGSVLRIQGVNVDEDDLRASGVDPTISRALLQPNVITEAPTEVKVIAVRDVAEGSDIEGHVEVEVGYRLSGESHTATYQVAPAVPMWGVLPAWRFVESPLGLLDVTVEHGALFQVDDVTIDTRVDKTGQDLTSFTQTSTYLVVAPARYDVSYDSALLQAKPQRAVAVSAGTGSVAIDVQPTEVYVEKVQAELDAFLSECAKQTVLQPTGCPFGVVIDDRVLSDPEWTLIRNPEVTLTAGENAFVMPQTEGAVNIKVRIQDLYDGTKSTIDREETYSVGISTRVGSDGTISIQLE